MAKKNKFYVVWQGHQPGVYTSWSDCEAQVKGFEGARFKSFDTIEQAREAEMGNPDDYIATPTSPPLAPDATTSHVVSTTSHTDATARKVAMPTPSVMSIIDHEAIAVDAACSGNPGAMEYRGVYLRTGKEIFHYGPVHGTNNIGEFLAIVHALALLEQQGRKMTIYSDSANAISWVRRKQCRTTLARSPKTEPLYAVIARAEAWLKAHRVGCPIKKWNTSEWGEIPADFGRK